MSNLISLFIHLSVDDRLLLEFRRVLFRSRVLDKIILNKDTRFILAFWQIFTAEQGIKIVVLIAYYL